MAYEEEEPMVADLLTAFVFVYAFIVDILLNQGGLLICPSLEAFDIKPDPPIESEIYHPKG